MLILQPIDKDFLGDISRNASALKRGGQSIVASCSINRDQFIWSIVASCLVDHSQLLGRKRSVVWSV